MTQAKGTHSRNFTQHLTQIRRVNFTIPSPHLPLNPTNTLSVPFLWHKAVSTLYGDSCLQILSSFPPAPTMPPPFKNHLLLKDKKIGLAYPPTLPPARRPRKTNFSRFGEGRVGCHTCALSEDAGQPFLPHPHHLHTVCFRGCLETVSGALQATPTCCSCSWHWPLPLLLQPLGWAPLPLPWATAAARHLATDALAPSSCPRTTSALWNPWGLLRAQSQQGYEPGTCFLFPQGSRANAGSRVD